MVASPAEMRSAATSLSSTSKPESAHTWAMPLPICPAPMMPTLRMEWAAACSPRAFGRSFTSTIFAYLLRSSAPHPLCSTPELFQLLGELGQGLIEVRHQSVVSDLKDRCLFVLVDRHDHLRILHAGKVLDG